MTYFDKTSSTVATLRISGRENKDEAYKNLMRNATSLSDSGTVDINIQKYMSLLPEEQELFRGIIKSKDNKTTILTPFEIKYAGKGEYVGWYLDGNERFLLEDGTVTHNTKIWAVKMQLRPDMFLLKLSGGLSMCLRRRMCHC